MNVAFTMELNKDSLGARLRAARKKLKLTQSDLADLVDLTQQSIGNIEKFSTSSIKMGEIAEAVGVSVNYLKTGKKDPKLELVKNPNSLTIDELAEALPVALDTTITTIRSILAHQGKLTEGDIPLCDNKDIILNVLTKSLIFQLTGDLFYSGLSDEHKTQVKLKSE